MSIHLVGDEEPSVFILTTDPLLSDTDGDGMPDGFEIAYGLNPLDPADAAYDMDGDGLSNLDEYSTTQADSFRPMEVPFKVFTILAEHRLCAIGNEHDPPPSSAKF